MLFAVGLAFILHEIGHKIVAKKYGCWAEFRADPKGLRFGIIMLSFSLGFLFMAPGAVMVSGLLKRRYNGYIAAVGPLTNLSLFIIGIPMWVLILGPSSEFQRCYRSRRAATAIARGAGARRLRRRRPRARGRLQLLCAPQADGSECSRRRVKTGGPIGFHSVGPAGMCVSIAYLF
eukprot:SAG31_NODE_6961_length_1833_cov_1.887543_1_plen_176_part_00